MYIRGFTQEKNFTSVMIVTNAVQQPQNSAHQRTHTGAKPYPCSECDTTPSLKKYQKNTLERKVSIVNDVAYALSRVLFLETTVGYTLETHCEHEKPVEGFQKILNLRKHQEFILKKKKKT